MSRFITLIVDVFLKQNADKRAFENFEKNVKSANVQAKPKEGVVSERFESKYYTSVNMFPI